MRILLCDDHAVFREGLRQVLSSLDTTFVEAETAAEALAHVAACGTPGAELDLVLLDLQLPDADGWEVFRTLRTGHPSLPVVIVSSAEDPAVMRRALEGGAAGFIPKSSTLRVLRAALELVLSGGVYVPASAMGAEASRESRAERRRRRASKLTPRQVEVLNLLARGLTNREIGEVLGIRENTVKSHIATLLDSLDVTNRTEAALVMRELDLEVTDGD